MIGCGNRASLDAISKLMVHRGPDAADSWWDDSLNIGFAHHRLAIIDLSEQGAQPMLSRDGRYVIAFNGEIYNYRALREELMALGHVFRGQSDTEVLLQGLIEWGTALLPRLDGMFAFSLLDRKSGEVLLARDHLGIKPLYFSKALGGGWVFASEIKSILVSGLIHVARDDAALHTPNRFMTAGQTGFLGIEKLPPAHYMRIRGDSVELKKFWEIDTTKKDWSDEEAIEQIHELVSQAVKSQLVADRKVGTFLSGGLDSSLIAALMRKEFSGEAHAFTIKFRDQDQSFEKASDDAYYAKKVAQSLDFKLHEIEVNPNVIELLPKMVWHMDEPLADPAAINTFLISQAARDLGIIVLLNGVGGDEVFGGYKKHLACLKAGLAQKFMPRFGFRLLKRGLNGLPVATKQQGLLWMRWAKRFLCYAELPEAERYLASDLSLNPETFRALHRGHSYYETQFWKSQAPRLQREDLDYLTRMCLNDTNVFLPDHNLLYSDKATMAASIETRPPLVQKDLVQAGFHLRPNQLIRGSVQKWVLKKVAEPYLDREVIYRSKGSFNSPLRAWIKGPLCGVVDELLSETQVNARGLYSAKEVRRMIEADRSGKEDHSMWIWNLLTVEIWHRTFLDRNPQGPITL